MTSKFIPEASKYPEIPVDSDQSPRRFVQKPTSNKNWSSEHWIKKEVEVVDMDWNNLMVVSRCCDHDEWTKIALALKEKYSQPCMLNPLMDVKALLISNSRILNSEELSGRWVSVGEYRIKI